uniref:Uncharacterized protein n=1 Tax=Rhizophora mucronata TaxID=61149 RepID=A0A2P2LUG6_RHIMU
MLRNFSISHFYEKLKGCGNRTFDSLKLKLKKPHRLVWVV